MSGICAIFNLDGSPVEPGLLEEMSKVTEYRGRDGNFIWKKGSIGILQQVTKTTPESTGVAWPLVDPANRLVLAADARIDNRPELIGLLRSKGEVFREVASDEELILLAYRVWRKDAPKHLVGDFAFLVWDQNEQSLFCGRDALGVKPLFYCKTGRTLVVGTEIAQLLVHPGVPRDLDEIAIGNFLVFNLSEPERTMFASIQAVPAAHYVLANSQNLSAVRYWEPFGGKEIRYRRDEEYAEHFRELFSRAILDRLRTTKEKVGIMLSGGLDSGSVASVIQKRLINIPGTPHLKAISVLYDHFPTADERDYIHALESELDLDVEYLRGDEFWLLRDPAAYTPNLETPSMGTEEISRAIFRKFLGSGIQVFLTGEGGDHLMTGSAMVYQDKFRRLDISVLPELFANSRKEEKSFLRLAYQHLFRPMAPDWMVAAYRNMVHKDSSDPIPLWLRKDFVDRTALSDRAEMPPMDSSKLNKARKVLDFQLRTVPSITLHLDRSTSLFGLEARHPFLDRKLVEYGMRIPQDQHFRAGSRKQLLRSAMRGILPQPILNRSGKATLESFFHYSLKEKEKNRVLDLFKNPILGIMGIINPNELREAYNQYCSIEDSDFEFSSWISTNPWRIICMELWLRQFSGIMVRINQRVD